MKLFTQWYSDFEQLSKNQHYTMLLAQYIVMA